MVRCWVQKCKPKCSLNSLNSAQASSGELRRPAAKCSSIRYYSRKLRLDSRPVETSTSTSWLPSNFPESTRPGPDVLHLSPRQSSNQTAPNFTDKKQAAAGLSGTRWTSTGAPHRTKRVVMVTFLLGSHHECRLFWSPEVEINPQLASSRVSLNSCK